MIDFLLQFPGGRLHGRALHAPPRRLPLAARRARPRGHRRRAELPGLAPPPALRARGARRGARARRARVRVAPRARRGPPPRGPGAPPPPAGAPASPPPPPHRERREFGPALPPSL